MQLARLRFEQSSFAIVFAAMKVNRTSNCNFILRITSELSGVKMRSIFMSGGGPQGRNELERFVIHTHTTWPNYPNTPSQQWL